MNGLQLGILGIDAFSPLFLLIYRRAENAMAKRAKTAPHTTPSRTPRWLWFLRFPGVKTVTCGVWSEELLELSLHVVKKERHKFPDVLKNGECVQKKIGRYQMQKEVWTDILT